MKKRVCFLLAALCVLWAALPSCAKNNQGLTRFDAHSFQCFDTATTISGYAENRQAFDRLANEAMALLEEYHRLYDIYQPYEGVHNLYTVNQTIGGVHPTITVDQKIIDLLLFAKEVHLQTQGTVNVAMGSVLRLWHDCRTQGLDDPASASLPSAEALHQAAQHTDIAHLVIDDQHNTVTLTDPLMRLDVGALAKGYATEQVALWLEQQGVSGWLLNVGGNVRAVGKKPTGDPWTVGLEDPRQEQEDYLATLQLTHEALVTSGSYQRYYVVEGKPYHHIIHPTTLMPAEGRLSVSVLCPDSGWGDALSTALFCMPVEQGVAMVEAMEDVEALWMEPDGTVTVSSGWNAYVKK